MKLQSQRSLGPSQLLSSDLYILRLLISRRIGDFIARHTRPNVIDVPERAITDSPELLFGWSRIKLNDKWDALLQLDLKIRAHFAAEAACLFRLY